MAQIRAFFEHVEKTKAQTTGEYLTEAPPADEPSAAATSAGATGSYVTQASPTPASRPADTYTTQLNPPATAASNADNYVTSVPVPSSTRTHRSRNGASTRRKSIGSRD
jgi:hypothetical protein